LGYYGGAQQVGYASLSGYGVQQVVAQPVAYAGYAQQAVAPQAPFQLDETILAEIESRLAYLTRRRQPVLRRQVIKVPGPVGRIQQVVRRLPTPQPDLIERVYVVKPQRDVVNLLIERPGTPPPQVQERKVVGRAHRPVINQQVVRVAPRVVQQPVAVAQPQVQYVQQAVVAQPQVQYVQQPVSYAPAVSYGGYDAGYSTSFDDGLAGYGGYQQAGYGYGAVSAAPAGAAYYGAGYPSGAYGYGVAQPAALSGSVAGYGYAADPYANAYGAYAAQPAYGSAVYGAQPAAYGNYGGYNGGYY
jgi:hypothetical protein